MAMSYADAAQHVRQMSNVFQSFQYLEEILSLVAGAERVLAEIEQRIQAARVTADQWIARDEATKTRLQTEINALTAQLAELDAAHVARMAEFAAVEAARSAEIAALTQQRDDLQRAVDDFRRLAVAG